MSTTKVQGDMIDDNAVTLAKMAGGTDGNLIGIDASGDPAYIATGSDGDVLTSGGVGVAALMEAAGGGGKILQVVSAFDDQYRSYSNTKYSSLVEYTQLRCTITPAATSSKICLSLSLSTGVPYGQNGHGVGFLFKRDSTVIGSGDNTSRSSVGAEVHAWDWLHQTAQMSHISGVFVDSPSSTSQIVYSVFIFAGYVAGGTEQNSTALVNSGGYSYGNTEQNIGGSQLVVMEIDGS